MTTIEYNVVSQDEAQRMIAAAVDYIKANNLPPMCLWVCDKAGVTVASLRMDGTAARYVHAAHRKAYSSAVFERDTAGIIDFWEGQAKAGHQREADWNDPMVTTLPGGYCVCNGRRGGNLQMWDVIGGFGAAGDDVEEHENGVAEAAIAALGEGFRHRRDWS
jgi:uncharacterized protein GlcG (DUF336 family)